MSPVCPLLLLILAQLAVAAQPEPVTTILERVATAAKQVGALRVTFQQEKHLAILDEPLITTGSIEIDRVNGLLRWQYDRGPVLILAAGRVKRWGADGKAESAGDDPALQAMAGQMKALTSGDWKPLQELFTMEVGHGPDHLLLRPRGVGMTAYIEYVEIAFRTDGSPNTLVLAAPGGDRTTYTFAMPDPAWKPDPSRFAGP